MVYPNQQHLKLSESHKTWQQSPQLLHQILILHAEDPRGAFVVSAGSQKVHKELLPTEGWSVGTMP